MYVGICTEAGKTVPDKEAFRYALERIENGQPKEQQEFLEWYYSGDWIKEEDDGRDYEC